NRDVPMVTEIMALDVQRKLLARLPGDFEFGESGLTLAERHAQVRQELLEISREMSEFSSLFWENASPSERVAYADSVVTRGERQARREAIERKNQMANE